MKRIILVTGGQRSGKSSYAEELALHLSPNPVYLATAHCWDDEFRLRIQRHQERRGSQWTNIEEEKFLSRHQLMNRVVLVDCITLWATNFFFEHNQELPDVDFVLEQLKAEFILFTKQNATFIFVTNEIGQCGISANPLQRRFTDLLGWLNQFIARQADDVIMMISGIPATIKGTGFTW